MSRALDTSKFRSALLPRGGIARPRLLAQLGAEGAPLLTVLRAPLGYGKSVLMAQLLDSLKTPRGFYRVDARDNDPGVFLAHWHQLLLKIPLAAQVPADQAWAAIRSHLDGLTQTFTLCLDDLQWLHSPRVLGYLESLLHQPLPHLRIVAACEGRPRLKVSHLRRDNRLLELTSAQLALDGEQTQQLLLAHDPSLDSAFTYRLQAGSEGWISGVLFWCSAYRDSQGQVAHERVEAAVQLSYQRIAQFIEEELLRQLPAALVRFIERTCVVNAFDLPLAAALGQTAEAQRYLGQLQAMDLFIEHRADQPLPWQYHPALRLSAQQRLRRRDPTALLQLHQQAADWLLAEQFYAQAVYQYGRAKNASALLATVEQHAFDLLREGEINAIVDFLGHALRDNGSEHLNLALTEASALIVTNDVERIRDCMRRLRRLATCDAREHTDRVMQTIGYLRSHLAWQGGNLRHGIDIVRTLRERHPARTGAAAILLADSASCLAALGRLRDARRQNDEALLQLTQLGFRGYAYRLHLQAAQIELAEGNTDQAWERFFEADLQPPQSRRTTSFYDAFLHLGRALVLMQRNQLDSARASFARAEKIALDFPHSAGLALIFLHQGCLFEALGDSPRAVAQWDESRRLARGFGQWRIYRLAGAWRVRHAVRQGDRAFVLAWLEQWQWCQAHYGDDVQPDEVMAYAWVQRHLGHLEPVLVCVRTLGELALEQRHRRLQLDLSILQSTLALDRGELQMALHYLDEGLALACEHSLGQLLHGEGAALGDLLQTLLSAPARRQYGLQRELPDSQRLYALWPTLKALVPAIRLVEPITRREREVLQRMARGQANAQIAESLFVSLSTVKTHINNIFRKLDVNDRDQALLKARNVGWLA
ncbi:LuxR C-terminal-related transcriptional regulator [Pseudomonas sp. dw_358]|uniref:LuxR C-terminal-related transcriptional regulator n=1 Tax=Pseudomonas sp. dw_358 TaxID=2720083 RepID=UPI001BD5C512